MKGSGVRNEQNFDKEAESKSSIHRTSCPHSVPVGLCQLHPPSHAFPTSIDYWFVRTRIGPQGEILRSWESRIPLRIYASAWLRYGNPTQFNNKLSTIRVLSKYDNVRYHGNKQRPPWLEYRTYSRQYIRSATTCLSIPTTLRTRKLHHRAHYLME
jgi:hypothetical protein